MNIEQYTLSTNRDNTIYIFENIGIRGRITKVISFDLTTPSDSTSFLSEPVYNLGFGDYDPITGTLDDTIASNNGDRDKVLATVAAAALDFLNKHPDAVLYAIGSTPNRTRLYQMGISRYLDVVAPTHQIWGRVGNDWLPFEQKQNYDAFVLKKR